MAGDPQPRKLAVAANGGGGGGGAPARAPLSVKLDSLSVSSRAIEPCRLRLKAEVGQGAFASVRHAELLPAPGVCHSGARDVAVKLLHKQLHTAHEIELFIREGELLRKLSHRYIASFMGCGWRCLSPEDSAQASPTNASAKGRMAKGEVGQAPASLPHTSSLQFFYVQEYCAGGSIGELVRRQMVKPFKQLYSDADALRWSLHIASALQYLHELQPAVMHRDLKLDNVMLTSPDTSLANAKLADFGLARHGPEEEDLEAPTTPRQVELARTSTAGDLTGRTGSYGSMAPEVLACRPYNASADIFSLGMCMHNLFARSLPCLERTCSGADDHMEVFAAKVAHGWRPPLPPRVPAPVAEVIRACWKGDPCLRASAGAVVQMLQDIQASGELAASPPDSPTPGCAACIVM